MNRKYVVSKVDIPYKYYNNQIQMYGLYKNKIYELAFPEEISPAPNNHEFIHIKQDGKIIPQQPYNFYSMEEWRSKQLEDLGI